MGYYTRYSLTFDADDADKRRELIDKAVADLEYLKEDAEMAKEFGFQYDWEVEALYDIWTDQADRMTFYNHEKPMRTLSKRHPDIVFVLSGEGQEAGDMWKKYFKNGKMQECQAIIVYPEFDEDKLQ